jgi:hypothetical protein
MGDILRLLLLDRCPIIHRHSPRSISVEARRRQNSVELRKNVAKKPYTLFL